MIGFLWETFKIKCLGGLREEVAREVKRHLRTNPAIRNVPQPFGYRMLKRLYGKDELISFLLRYSVLYAFIIVACGAIVSMFPGWVPKSALDTGSGLTVQEITSYFLAAQAVMIGLLFPVALGVISLITQREDASSTVSDLQVYYSESFAFGVGASGIALSIALAIHVFWPAGYMLETMGFGQAGMYFEAVLLVAHLCWLLVNFAALWHFLFTSLSFLQPAQRALMRRRYAALVVIAADLTAKLLGTKYDQYVRAELTPDAEKIDILSKWASPNTKEREEIEVRKPSFVGFELVDVRRKLLNLARYRWMKRCKAEERKAGIEDLEPRLIFPLGFRKPLGDDGVICRRIGGMPLTRFERFLICLSFSFEGKKS